MKAQHVEIILRKAIRARFPILITGAPGVGKTRMATSACEAEGNDLVLWQPVVDQPEDYKGLPANVDGRAEFLAYGQLRKLIEADRPTVAFFDDFGQAPAAVQAAAMQLLLARELNGQRVSEHVTFVVATNRKKDRAGVGGILEPVKSRFRTIIELEPDLDTLIRIAAKGGWHPTVPAFLRMRPDLLHAFVPTTEMTNSPSPRTWEFVSDWMNLDLDDDVRFDVIKGAVGEGAAAEFVAFVRMFEELPHVDAIILDPDGSPVPESNDLQWAVVGALAQAANKNTFANVFRYAQRLPSEKTVAMLRDAARRSPGLVATPTWLQYVTGPLGDLVMGDL